MADQDRMPRVDLNKISPESGLTQAHLDYIKQMERKNLERVTKLMKVRRRNLLTGVTLAATVAGVYFYSMYAVKQETFLDDFDEPVPVDKPN